MQRFFVKNLVFVIAVNLLVKPMWVFVIDRNVQNLVGHADYGTYQALLNLALIFNIILDFGLTYYNTSIISGEPGRLKTLFPVMLSARLTLVLIFGAVVLIAALLLGYSGRELALLGGILLIQSLNSLMLFLRSNVSALHKFKLDAILSVIDRLLMIVLCGFLLFYPPLAASFSIEWFVAAQVVCYAIAVVLGIIVLRRMAGVLFRFSVDTKEIVAIIRKSLPYASLVFLMAIHMRADTILLERMSGVDSKKYAGIYAAGYRLLEVGNMFGIMFSGMLLPMFGRMLARKTDIKPIIRLSVNMLLPVAFIVSGAALFYGTDIMMLLYTNADSYSGAVFSWLMACFPAYCVMYVYSTLLTANNDLKLLNKVAIAGVVINLSLNFWLIPEQQALGAAKTAFITQTFLAVLYIFFSGKKLNLAGDTRWLITHGCFIAVVIGAGYISRLIPFSWVWQLAAYAAFGFCMIFLFKFVSIQSIKKLMEKD